MLARAMTDRLWIIRPLFEKLNDTYDRFYSPPEHLAVVNVILLFYAVIFKQYIL
jgi:hypothetical protein